MARFEHQSDAKVNFNNKNHILHVLDGLSAPPYLDLYWADFPVEAK
jgi:hypothetical protein